MRWVFPGGKTAGREDVHSPPSSAEAKNAWNYTSTYPYVFVVLWLVSTEHAR